MEKLGYVDAARGIAVLAVILVHTALAVQGLSPFARGLAEYGQTGVQLFFVASAYTLCLAYERRKGEPMPVVSFLTRRFFRIAPLYYLAITLYFLLHVGKQWLHHSQNIEFYPYSALNVISNLAFVHGFVPESNNNIVPGGWSIGTEVAFYACFPVIFSMVKILSSKNKMFGIAAVAISVLLNLCFQIAVSHYLSYPLKNNSFYYFSLANQLPVFLVGMSAYFLHSRGYFVKFTDSIPVQCAGFASLTAGALLLWRSPFDLAFAIIPVLSGASFFFLLNLLRRACHAENFLHRIGKVSYSVYVSHFIVVWLVAKLADKFIPYLVQPELVLGACFFFVAAITFQVAIFTEKMVENRGIAFGRQIVARLHSLPQTRRLKVSQQESF